jgi:hypothetical protein
MEWKMDARMEQAVRRFFIDGIDLLGQHKTPEDLAFSMQFALDLIEEGQESSTDSRQQAKE